MAAGVVLGFLKYVLGFDTVSFKKGMSEADRELVLLQKKFQKHGAQLQGLGKSMAAFVTLPLAALAGAGIREAQETAAAMAQVKASLASMGPVAGKTAGELQKAANAFEGSSLFEADRILKDITAPLLTFGAISGKTFDRAQQAALDLATKFDLGPRQAAIMLGKALQDPIKGITALGRAGVSFSEDQKAAIKAMVETGNVAGAQSLILAALETQVRGSAQAAQDADPWNKLTDAFNGMAETVGNALIPIIPVLANAIASVANAFNSLSPETQKWLIIIGGTAAVAGPVLVVLGSLVTVIGSIAPLVVGLTKAWAGLKLGVLAARVAMVGMGPVFMASLGPLALLVAAVGAVYLAWKNWDKITAFVSGVYTAVKTWLVDKLNAVWDGVKAKIQSVTDSFKWMYDAVVGHSYIPDMIDGIARSMAELQQIMVDPALSATEKVGAAFQSLSGLIGELFGHKAGGILSSLGNLAMALAPLFGGGFDASGFGKIVAANDDWLSKGMSFGGGMAKGGPVVPGKAYVVGENGPEFVSFGRRGYVSPPRDGGGAARVTVVPSKYFDVVVDGRAAAVAAPMAGRAAAVGAAGGQQGVMRRADRRFP